MSLTLVTGAAGFVGREVVAQLTQRGMGVRAATRTAAPDTLAIGNITATTDWSAALEGVDSVIHTAARVHVMHDVAADSEAEFRQANVESTLNLARQAQARGIRRFVYVSSIKVNGEGTRLGHPYRADDPPDPHGPYARSKLMAERQLLADFEGTGMEVTIVRPPLVYGPGVRANFKALMRMVEMGVPLPLGSIHNKRSLVAVQNLADLLVLCTHHPLAANQVFLVSDDHDLSTTELLKRLAAAMGKPSRILPFPPSALRLAAGFLGKSDVASRLLDNLQVDVGKTRMLGWTPLLTVDEALRLATQH